MLIANHLSCPLSNDDDISNNGQKNRNHPKLYVGTSHHAIFHVPSVGPGTCDIVSDWNDITNDDANTAHRGDKWWYMGKGGKCEAFQTSAPQGTQVPPAHIPGHARRYFGRWDQYYRVG